MPFRSYVLSTCLIGALGVAAPPANAAGDGHRSSENCFLSANWEGWKSPSPRVIYLRVRINDIYRLELSASSSQLQDPDVHLVNRVRGSDWICSPLDLDLEVVDDHGVMREPLFVKSIARLSPDEVKAIPAKFRP